MNSLESPVVLEGHLDSRISRALWLVKWLLLIPHYVILLFLWIAFVVLTVIAWFAILFTGRYPRAIFDFNLGVLRWTWRVDYYGYAALGTDTYPPFTLEDVADYPARLHIAYPEQLSRGLVLVKSWLLAIPHLLVLAFFLGGGLYATQGSDAVAWSWGSGVVGLLVLFAGLVMLFGRRYPQGIFDLVLGIDRWAVRVAAYVFLMTDTYPPFRLDQGGSDPARPIPPEPSTPSGEAATPRPEANPVGSEQP